MNKKILLIFIAGLCFCTAAFAQIIDGSDAGAANFEYQNQELQIQALADSSKTQLSKILEGLEKMRKAQIDLATLDPDKYIDNFTYEVSTAAEPGSYINDFESGAVKYLLENKLLTDTTKVRKLANAIIEMENDALGSMKSKELRQQEKSDKDNVLTHAGRLIVDWVGGWFAATDNSVANAIKALSPLQSYIVDQYGLEYLAGANNNSSLILRSFDATEAAKTDAQSEYAKVIPILAGYGSSSSSDNAATSYSSSSIEGLETLEQLAVSTDDNVAIASIGVLGNLRDPEAPYLLSRMYFKDKNRACAILAARAVNYSIYQSTILNPIESQYDLKVAMLAREKAYLNLIYSGTDKIMSNIVAAILGKTVLYPDVLFDELAKAVVSIIEKGLYTAVPENPNGYLTSIKTLEKFEELGQIGKMKQMQMLGDNVTNMKSISIGTTTARTYQYATTVDITKDATIMKNVLRATGSGVALLGVPTTGKDFIVVNNETRTIYDYDGKWTHIDGKVSTKTAPKTTTGNKTPKEIPKVENKVDWGVNSWTAKTSDIEASLDAGGLSPTQQTNIMTALADKTSSATRLDTSAIKFVDGNTINTTATLSADKVLTIVRVISGLDGVVTTITETYQASSVIEAEFNAKAEAQLAAETENAPVVSEDIEEINAAMTEYQNFCKDAGK